MVNHWGMGFPPGSVVPYSAFTNIAHHLKIGSLSETQLPITHGDAPKAVTASTPDEAIMAENKRLQEVYAENATRIQSLTQQNEDLFKHVAELEQQLKEAKETHAVVLAERDNRIQLLETQLLNVSVAPIKTA